MSRRNKINPEDQFIWCEKYRPQSLDDCILPERFIEELRGLIEGGEMHNLLFCGGPGIGKTTVAKALCNDMNADVLVINASKDGNIDTLRTTIQNFAMAKSFEMKKKVCILDEADYLNANSTQPALRNFIEEYSHNCFSGKTKIATLEYGTVEFQDLVGKTVSVRNINGDWKPVKVRYYGDQELIRVKFGKFNSNDKNHHHYVDVTRNHEWVLADGTRTRELKLGDTLFTPNLDIKKSNEGIIHGMIYGDGSGHKGYVQGHNKLSIQGQKYSTIRICKQDKVQLEMQEYLDGAGYNYTTPPSANGDRCYHLGNFPYSKCLPHTNDPEYISGFIYGWWLADGLKHGRNDSLQISTINDDAYDWLMDNAVYAGLVVTGLNHRAPTTGFDSDNTLHTITLSSNPMTVRGIDSLYTEAVYCVEEPETNTFTLGNGLLTGNCRFILTCNYPKRIIEPLHSRLREIHFSFDRKEQAQLGKQFLNRFCEILEAEGKEYDKKAVAQLILKYTPDYRKILNELQGLTSSGTLDNRGIGSTGESLVELAKWISEKKFTECRKWVAEHYDVGFAHFMKVRDHLEPLLEKQSIPDLFVYLNEFQNQTPVDSEVHLTACITTLMFELEYK